VPSRSGTGGRGKSGPAPTSSTRRPRSASRAATTALADPAPTTSTSGSASGRSGAGPTGREVTSGPPPSHSIVIICPTISVIWLTTPGWVITLTTAGLPESIARRIAGPTSAASSTRSPWPPTASASFS
jgi:hypothetical protein